MRRQRRRIVLLHERCRGELVKGANGVWTCRKCHGKVEIGENSTALLVGDGIRQKHNDGSAWRWTS